jgi:hypothetical protein
MDSSTVIIVLAMFTFIAVLAFAFMDLKNTDEAIKRHAGSAHTNPRVGPQV